MTTVRTILNNALSLINVKQLGENPTAAEMEVAQDALNQLLASWGTDALNIHKKQPYLFPLTPGVASYTLGPTGDWVVPRPNRVDAANVLLNSEIYK